MNMKAVIPLALAMVLGLVAAFLAKNAMSHRGQNNANPGNQVSVVNGLTLTNNVLLRLERDIDNSSNLFDVGHRIRVDVSSSNWPRLEINPNTGEPVGRHTHQVVAEQAVFCDSEHPSFIVLPVIPAAA